MIARGVCWVALLLGTTAGAQFDEPSNRLSAIDSITSQSKQLRGDLIHAAAYPLGERELAQLLARSSAVDRQLQTQLSDWSTRLRQLDGQLATEEIRSMVSSLRRRSSLAWLSRVELSVLQSELFASDSADAASSGAASVRLAEWALVNLPAESVVRDEIVRLLAEAHLRSGDPDAAAVSVKTFLKSKPVDAPEIVVDDRVGSLIVRILLAKGDLEAAAIRLQSFFGNEPPSAPPSPPMDLARLQYLLAARGRDRDSQPEAAIGDWIDAIGRRSGPLAKARAETLVSREGRLSDVADPRLRIADGLYQLRTGNPIAAAVTLAKSAVADPDAARSIRTATQSAAVLVSQSKSQAAAELLLQVAGRHAGLDDAAALALQAAGLLADAPDQDAKTVAILRQIITEWPRQDAGRVARDWLIQRAIDERRWTDAASLAIDLPSVHWNEPSMQRCEILWQIAAGVPVSLLGWNDFGDAQALPRCRNGSAWQPTTLAELFNRPAIENADAELATVANLLELKLSQNEADIPAEVNLRLRAMLLENLGSFGDESLFSGIATFRSGQTNQLPQGLESAGRLNAITWRLDRDGQIDPSRRVVIGNALLRLNATTVDTPIASWRWRVWAGASSAAIADWRQQSPGGAATYVLAAALSDSGSSPLQALALPLWQDLASGLERGSTPWHIASIHAIESQRQSGDHEAAIQAAEYLKLTSPPIQPDLLDRLKRLTQ